MWILHFLSVSWLHCHYAAVTTDSNYRLALIRIWYAVPQGLHKCKCFGISGLEEHKWLLTTYLPVAMLLLLPGKWGFSMKFCWPKKRHCFRVYNLDWLFVGTVFVFKISWKRPQRMKCDISCLSIWQCLCKDKCPCAIFGTRLEEVHPIDKQWLCPK